jgi:hypothetical protein
MAPLSANQASKEHSMTLYCSGREIVEDFSIIYTFRRA